VKVVLRNPTRELEIDGPWPVSALLQCLELTREAQLVIGDGTLVPADKTLHRDTEVEIRPVISGG